MSVTRTKALAREVQEAYPRHTETEWAVRHAMEFSFRSWILGYGDQEKGLSWNCDLGIRDT